MEKSTIKERTEYIIKTINPFKDDRGIIDNYELVFPVNMANVITSKKGTMRANHYHPEQLQQCLVISGKYISVFKDLAVVNGEVKSQIISAGDLAVMPPMIAHTMIFLEDCTFINLVGGNRDHDKFGIVHTMPYELVPKDKVEEYIKKHNQ